MNKEELIKIYQTHKLYIFPAGIIISCLILIVFVIYPQIVNLITHQKTQLDLSNKSDFLEAKAQELESYNPQDLSQKVNYAVSSYPTSKDYVSALSTLQNLISQSGFSTISMNLLGDAISSENVSAASYNIRVDTLGPLASLHNILTGIESSARLMRVSSIEVTPGKDPTVGTAAIVVEVLYSPAQQGGGGIDSPIPKLSEKEEEIINKLARIVSPVIAQTTTTSTDIAVPTQLGPRGKTNPFE